MRTFAPSLPRFLLAILICATGILSASLVLATLVLLAVDGHAQGLLVTGVGALIPVCLWETRRLTRFARARPRSRPSRRAKLGIKLKSTSARWPPTGEDLRLTWEPR